MEQLRLHLQVKIPSSSYERLVTVNRRLARAGKIITLIGLGIPFCFLVYELFPLLSLGGSSSLSAIVFLMLGELFFGMSFWAFIRAGFSLLGEQGLVRRRDEIIRRHGLSRADAVRAGLEGRQAKKIIVVEG